MRSYQVQVWKWEFHDPMHKRLEKQLFTLDKLFMISIIFTGRIFEIISWQGQYTRQLEILSLQEHLTMQMQVFED